MLLVNGDLARFELVDALFVDVRADNFMTRRREAGSGDQAT